MILSKHSKDLLLNTFDKWHVDKDFADPMFNYLVYGFNPGSCFTAVLANDFQRAIASSHPANTVEAFKKITGWIHSEMPCESYGSYDAVNNWCYLTSDRRRAILEQHNLIYSEERETWLVLSNEPTTTPVFY